MSVKMALEQPIKSNKLLYSDFVLAVETYCNTFRIISEFKRDDQIWIRRRLFLFQCLRNIINGKHKSIIK